MLVRRVFTFLLFASTAAILGTALGAGYVLVTADDGADRVAQALRREAQWEGVAPATPSMVLPQDGAFPESRTPTFTWSEVTDESGVAYVLEYSTDPDFERNFTWRVANLFSPTYKVPEEKALPPGMLIHWRVMAVDGWWNASPWSGTRTFRPMVELFGADAATPIGGIDVRVYGPPVPGDS